MGGLLGRKVGMTRLFIGDSFVPVTILKVGPCIVCQKKTMDVDGYTSIQVGFEEKKEKKTTKPMMGHFKKAELKPMRFLKEFRVDNIDDYSLGQEITLSIFNVGDKIDVSALTKGRGFAGVMKRWNFSGGEASHGSKFHRAPGSTGQHSYPARVFPGKKMPGHYGNEKVTIHNLKIVKIDPENNLIAVKGAVPGSKTGLVVVRKAVRQKLKKIRI